MAKQKRQGGVTIIELLVVVAIIAILAMLTYPNFAHSKLEARRSDAQSAVIATEAIVERYLTENNKQTFDTNDLALAQFANYDAASSTPEMSDEGYYRITITPDSGGYTVSATATTDGSLTSCASSANAKLKQCEDTLCREIFIYHGARQSKDSSGTVADETTTKCW